MAFNYDCTLPVVAPEISKGPHIWLHTTCSGSCSGSWTGRRDPNIWLHTTCSGSWTGRWDDTTWGSYRSKTTQTPEHSQEDTRQSGGTTESHWWLFFDIPVWTDMKLLSLSNHACLAWYTFVSRTIGILTNVYHLMLKPPKITKTPKTPQIRSFGNHLHVWLWYMSMS